jgi:hypothetical protein
MYYEDGSVYEGEWYGDKRNGKGLLRLANGNRYEGSWSNDMKNGAGKFYYLDKGQVYVGNWVDDIAKCGTLEDFGREGAPEPPIYPIPEVRLTTMITVIKSSDMYYHDLRQLHEVLYNNYNVMYSYLNASNSVIAFHGGSHAMLHDLMV